MHTTTRGWGHAYYKGWGDCGWSESQFLYRYKNVAHNFQVEVTFVLIFYIMVTTVELITKVSDGVDDNDDDSYDVGQHLKGTLSQDTIVTVEGTEC